MDGRHRWRARSRSRGGQPGGWAYNILPFIERQALHDLGSNLPVESPEQKLLLGERDAVAVDTMYCPSRRAAAPHPVHPLYGQSNQSTYNGVTRVAGKTDYAVNAGAEQAYGDYCDNIVHPVKVREFDMPGGDAWLSRVPVTSFSGINWCGSEVKFKHVTDGNSQTYAVGEKYLDPLHYDTGQSPGDDWSMYTGFQNDIARATFWDPQEVTNGGQPVASTPFARYTGVGRIRKFRKHHPAVCLMSFLDGHVEPISFDIDPEVHYRYGHRADGGDMPSF